MAKKNGSTPTPSSAVPAPARLAKAAPSQEPKFAEPKGHPNYQLFTRVREALLDLPSLFESAIGLSGILATDIHTFNTSMGASIEDQMVQALNKQQVREKWDPDGKLLSHRFVRRTMSFPDVVLLPPLSATPLLGIELKGWFLLAKEGEPSFRMAVTPAACAPIDLVAVFPWALDNVLSGKPMLYTPFVEGARYLAEYRNWDWCGRDKPTGERIFYSPVTAPYPTGRDPADDEPEHDKGHNFGRIARTGVMDEFVRQMNMETLLGIPVQSWREFLKLHSSSADPTDIAKALARWAKTKGVEEEKVERLRGALAEIEELLR